MSLVTRADGGKLAVTEEEPLQDEHGHLQEGVGGA